MSLSRSTSARAFSLIEILVVISVIALLVAILMPSLIAAREQGRIAQCLSNLRSHMQSTQIYVESDSNKLIQWHTYPALPGYTVQLFTPAVFGGFKAPIGVNDAIWSDAELYPAEVRPLNAVVNPMARGGDIIDLYKCPSDRSYTQPGVSGAIPPLSENLRAWEAIGTRYPLNTGFMIEYCQPSSTYAMSAVEQYSRRISAKLVGGMASRFIMWYEQRFLGLSNGASVNPTHSMGPPPGFGWHKQFSRHAASFFDGHADYRYFDTRTFVGDGWTTWEPK